MRPMRLHLNKTYLIACLSLTSCVKPQAQNESRPLFDKAVAGPRVVGFAPGIRIDYHVPQVEIDGEIILREGALELFAYAKAPTPKEHESIVLLRSSPEAIYQALGLIGLTPGKPIRYDAQTKTTRPPTGDAVDVYVRYSKESHSEEVSVCDWMYNVNTKRPMSRTHWLFTGSEHYQDGTFAANIEGTIVTVVDFPSAILSLPASHTDSDAELWLKANTEDIPPVGTKVVLILRPHREKDVAPMPTTTRS
jgi:hypothetical protein